MLNQSQIDFLADHKEFYRNPTETEKSHLCVCRIRYWRSTGKALPSYYVFFIRDKPLDLNNLLKALPKHHSSLFMELVGYYSSNPKSLNVLFQFLKRWVPVKHQGTLKYADSTMNPSGFRKLQEYLSYFTSIESPVAIEEYPEPYHGLYLPY